MIPSNQQSNPLIATKHSRLDFGALLQSIIGNFKGIIGSSLVLLQFAFTINLAIAVNDYVHAYDVTINYK